MSPIPFGCWPLESFVAALEHAAYTSVEWSDTRIGTGISMVFAMRVAGPVGVAFLGGVFWHPAGYENVSWPRANLPTMQLAVDGNPLAET